MIKKLLISFLFILLFSLNAHAACTESPAGTWTTDSASFADVDECVNTTASAGDTVIIGGASATWTSALSITDSITIRGLTEGCPDACDNGTKITGGGSNSLISINVTGDKTIDISKISFDANGNSRGLYIQNQSITVPLYNVRIHHIEIKGSTGVAGILVGGDSGFTGLIFGLIDNCKFTDNAYDAKVFGSSASVWTNFPGLANIGTKEYVYFEDNISTGITTIALASGTGARWVSRYNTFDMTASGPGDSGYNVHGDTQNRGVVAYEIYENTFDPNESRPTLDSWGGTGIVFNNDINIGLGRGKIAIRETHQTCSDGSGVCWEDPADSNPCGDEVNNTYLWNNWNTKLNQPVGIFEVDAGDLDFDPPGSGSCIDENENYWDDASTTPDNSSADTNFDNDISANRDTENCTAQDSYYETDTEKLYRCTSTDTWEFIYSPYTYPHPLQGVGLITVSNINSGGPTISNIGSGNLTISNMD